MAPAGLSHFQGGSISQLIKNHTLASLLAETVVKCGTKNAYICPDENLKLTFLQLKLEADKLAAGLLSIGVNAGDNVMLWGGNHLHLFVAALACSRAAIIFSSMNPSLSPEAVEQHLKKGGFKCLICFPTIKAGAAYDSFGKLCPEIVQAAKGHLEDKRFPGLTHVIVAEDTIRYSGCYSLSEVFGLGAANTDETKLNEIAAAVKSDDPAAIYFTSGTTGEIKGVILSHFQLINSGMVAGKRLYLDQPGEVLCCPMPNFRGPAMTLALVSVVALGATVVFPAPTALPPAIFKSIQDEKCTCLLSNPIALHLMLRLPYVKQHNIESLTSVCLVGDTMPVDLITLMQKNTSIADVTVGIFMTEFGCMPVFFPQDGNPQKLLSTHGSVADHTEVQVVGCDGQPLPVSSVGEICIKAVGGSEFLGYCNDSKTSHTRYVDGWLHTRDAGSFDVDGYLTLHGQINDIIKGNGAKCIYPWILERKISVHPAVLGVQVVGGAGEGKDGRQPVCACVIVKEKSGQTVDRKQLKEDLVQMCREEKMEEPEHVLFVKDFPRTSSRKIQKFKLREMLPTLLKGE